VTAAIGRAIAGAVTALTLWAAAQLLYAAWLCPPYRTWQAVHAGTSVPVMVQRGERLPRAGDAVFTCETTHRIGPMALHEDLDCYCAPSGIGIPELDRLLGGICRADDGKGPASCGAAYCGRYVDAPR
jgi:hypothetical protein